MGYEVNRSFEDGGPIYRTKLDKCPYCGKIFDSASEIVRDGPPPKPEDISVCFKCGGFLQFDENLLMKKLSLKVFTSLTPEERSNLIGNLNTLVEYKESIGELYTITFDYENFLKGFYEKK